MSGLHSCLVLVGETWHVTRKGRRFATACACLAKKAEVARKRLRPIPQELRHIHQPRTRQLALSFNANIQQSQALLTTVHCALQNEPHTRDKYEQDRGMPAGQLVRNWLGEMSAWLKGLDPNHLISTGEEGYRADGPTDTIGNVGANGWINGGYKGQAVQGYCA